MNDSHILKAIWTGKSIVYSGDCWNGTYQQYIMK